MEKVRRKPGPPPGTHHAGTFKKGDPRINREGAFVRKKMTFNQMINKHTEKAVQSLVDTLEDEDASKQDKFKCAELILAHAQGSPVNRTVQAQLSHNVNGDTQVLTLDQLQAKAAALIEDMDDVIDGDYEEVPPGES